MPRYYNDDDDDDDRRRYSHGELHREYWDSLEISRVNLQEDQEEYTGYSEAESYEYSVRQPVVPHTYPPQRDDREWEDSSYDSRYDSAYDRDYESRVYNSTQTTDEIQPRLSHRRSNTNSKTPAKKSRYTLKQKRIITIALVAAILFPILVVGLGSLQQVLSLKTLGTNGIQEITAIKTLLSATYKGAPASAKFEDKAKSIFQPAIIAQVRAHSQNALNDFENIDQQLSQHAGILGLVGITPYSPLLTSLEHLARVGIDGANIGIAFTDAAPALADIFNHGSLFSSDGAPFLLPASFDALKTFALVAKGQLDNITANLAQADVASLPVKASQLQQLQALKTQLPGIASTVDAIVGHMDGIRWLLGVDSPRTFLIQTMDRGELRPTGGFTGQYGVLTITGGRLGKISLTDVSNIDFSPQNPFLNDGPPAPYNTWWPWLVWGLRDANLSPDYPSSAKIAAYAYDHETKQNVDGVISFSPLVIEHLLTTDILGPITVPCYNVVVNSQNLESVLHYYQLGAGTAQESKCVSAANANTSSRKRFTAALAQVLQDQLRTAPSASLSKALKVILQQWSNKEVETYFTDPTAESLLNVFGLTGGLAMPAAAKDATAVIQTNMAANKGSIYVTTKIQETITLDAQGNARHDLAMTLDYRPTGDVYGIVTMRDYLRVYAPPGSQLISGMGFDQTGQYPYCPGECTPPRAPVCEKTPANPYGLFLPGAFPGSLATAQGSTDKHTDVIAGPTNTSSDVTGRSMFGGLVVIPAFCMATVTLSWQTPHAYTPGQPYQFVLQHQSDTFYDVTVTVNPATTGTFTPVNSHVASLESDTLVVVKTGT